MNRSLPTAPSTYGLMAEFTTPEKLKSAAERAYRAGYREMEAYSPLPIHGLPEAVGFRGTSIPLWTLLGGISGCVFGFGLCYYMAAAAYVHNVGGRPPNSWPMWIPIMFECTILFAALTAVTCVITFNGLPQHYHPVFNVARFARASRDRFFLCIETSDPNFDPRRTLEFLQEQDPYEISPVEH